MKNRADGEHTYKQSPELSCELHAAFIYIGYLVMVCFVGDGDMCAFQMRGNAQNPVDLFVQVYNKF